MQKAEDIAEQKGHNKFKSSEGWLHRWKKQHDLCYTKLHGEASEAASSRSTGKMRTC